jgi:hypothetical protein
MTMKVIAMPAEEPMESDDPAAAEVRDLRSRVNGVTGQLAELYRQVAELQRQIEEHQQRQRRS